MTSDKITTVTGTDDRAVALIASDGADRDHLAGLVKKLGYGVNTYPNAAEFDRCDEPSRAAIICFRVASATSRVPDMPETLRGQRVLVYSDLSEERHIVEALNAGAHHFFRIDESMNVMLARMGAALRRYDRVRVDSLSVPPFRFDLARRRVSLDGKPLELSPREFDLAFYLFANGYAARCLSVTVPGGCCGGSGAKVTGCTRTRAILKSRYR